MGILSWIIFGLIAGILAKWIMPGKDGGGFIVTVILGIVGAVVGGWISTLFGFGKVDGFNFGSFAVAVIGALGNLGGFLAPTVKTFVEQHFDNPHAGMYFLAGTALLGALMLLRTSKTSTGSAQQGVPAATR